MVTKRKCANLAIVFGLTIALSVGQVPAVAFAGTSESGSRQNSESQVVEEGLEGASSASATARGGGLAGGADLLGTDDSGSSIGEANTDQTSIVGLTEPQPVVTGESAVLPETVVATFDDGTSSDVPVSWSLNGAKVDTGTISLDPGFYSFLGTVEGTALTVSYEVEIAAPDEAAQNTESEDTNEQATAQQAPQGKVAGSQSIEIDGVTWSYNASYVLPTGFDPAHALGYEIPWDNLNITFTSETGDTFNWYLADCDSRDFSQVNYSQAGEYDATFTVTEYNENLLAGQSFPVHFTFMDAVEIPTEFNATIQVQTVAYPDSYPYVDIPYYQSLKLTDGSTYEAHINWNEDDLENLYQKVDTPGEYTIHGNYYSDEDRTTTATVWVQGIRSVSPVEVHTTPGKAPVMPDTVNVEYQDGTGGWANVTWDPIDPSQYAEKDTFQVVGTVENTDIKAVAEIYVSDLLEVTNASVVVAAGNALNNLYEGVSLRYELGYMYLQPNWTLPSSDDPCWSTPGTFQIHGTVEGYDYDFICDVTVIDVTSYESEINVTTCPGYLNLPSMVYTTSQNGESVSLYVEWDYDWNPFEEPGSYTVKGVIEGTDLPVVANIEVLEITNIQGIAQSYSTIEGILPELPANAIVVLEDGSTLNLGVSWSTPSPDAFTLEASPIAVTGKLLNGDQVSTEVRVLWTQPMRDQLRISTLVGMAPPLPDTTQVTMSDGTTRTVDGQWDTPNPQDYAQAGTSFEVSGYIQGSDYQVSANVAVCDAADEILWSMLVAKGDTPIYPTYLSSITLDNGDTYEVPYNRLVWNEPDLSSLAAGDTVEVTGTVLGSSAELKGSLTIVDAAKLMQSSYEVNYLPYKYAADIESYIPQYTRAFTASGEAFDTEIAWDNFDPAIANTPGTYELKGTAAGLPVTCTINVLKATKAVAIDPLVVLAGNIPYMPLVYMDVYCDDGNGEESVFQYSVSEFNWGNNEDVFKTPGVHDVEASTNYFGNESIPVSLTVETYADVVSVEGNSGWATPQGQYSIPYELDVTLGMPDTSPLSSVVSLFTGNQATTTKTISMSASWNVDFSSMFAGATAGETIKIPGTIYDINYPVVCDVEIVDIKSISAPSVSTAPGVEPDLPYWVPVQLSNGTTDMVPVSWSYDYDREALKTPGATIEIEGTVLTGDMDSQSLTVSCLVTVEGVAAVAENSTEALTSLVSEVGSQPVLPEVMPVELTDGTFASAVIEWDWNSVDKSLFNQVGAEFNVPGTIQGYTSDERMARSAAPNEVSAHVKIVESEAEPEVSYVYPTVTTLVASDAEKGDLIASGAICIMSDGEYDSVSIEWDYSSLDLNTPGTYVVMGTVFETNQTTYAYVTVVGEKDVRIPENVQPVKLTLQIPEDGFTLAQLSQELPASVLVTYSTGDASVVPVGWNLEEITSEQLSAGNTLYVKGVIEGIPTLEATAEVTLVGESSGDVVVLEGSVEPIAVETYRTFAPELPKFALFKFSDESIKELGITWESVSASDYNVEGEFTVHGVVSEYGNEVTATVTVKPYIPVTGIEVNCDKMDESGVLYLNKGETAQLQTSIIPTDATFADIAFSSNDSNIATISENGTITAGNVDGSTSIKLEARGYTKVIQVVVGEGETSTPDDDPILVSSVSISGEGIENGSVMLSKGATLQLNASVEPANADNKALTWTTSDASVATVNENGIVTAVAGGTATITATASSGAFASVTITVPRSLESTVLELVNPDACKVKLGDTFDISVLEFQLASIYDDGSRDVTPIPVDEVEITGMVDTQKVGNYTLTATVKNSPELTCEFVVNVWDPNAVADLATDENAADSNEEDAKALTDTSDSATWLAFGAVVMGTFAVIGTWMSLRRRRGERQRNYFGNFFLSQVGNLAVK